MEINQEVLNNATEIWADLPNTLHEEPYMPCNGTEGDIFEARWCYQCVENSSIEYDCTILTSAYCGQQPKEWIYYNNKPICTAFKIERESNGL